jgi:hypothetical protein
MNRFPSTIQTHVVTLRQTPLRTKAVVDQLQTLEIPHTVFYGIHAKSFGITSTIPWDGYVQVLKEPKLFEPYYMTPGQIGCAMSHYALWKSLENSPSDEFLILEDDALFCDNFIDKFNHFYESLPPGWKLAYLGCQEDFSSGKSVPINDCVGVHPKPYTTHAYLAKKEVILKMMEGYIKLQEPIDIYIVNRIQPTIATYVATPQLVFQQSLRVSIHETKSPFYSMCRDVVLPDADKIHIKAPSISKDIDYVCKIGVTLGEGWKALEENLFRWTGKEASLFVYAKQAMDVDIKFGTPIPCTCSVELTDGQAYTYKIKPGNNHLISLRVKEGATGIVLRPSTFVPMKLSRQSTDPRELGICVRSITVNGTLKQMGNIIDNVYVEGIGDFFNKFQCSVYGNNMNLRGEVIIGDLPYDIPNGKMDVSNQLVHYSHRSGWANFVEHLVNREHHRDRPKFLGRVERTLPCPIPWCGFLHSPWDSPTLDDPSPTVKDLLQTNAWKDSIIHCKGLWVFSQEVHDNLRPHVPSNVGIDVLPFPTEFDGIRFDFSKFKSNPMKWVVSAGINRRNFGSLNRLNVYPLQTNYLKLRLIPHGMTAEQIEKHIEIQEEITSEKLTRSEWESVSQIRHISNEDYDRLLSQNIVFLDLFAEAGRTLITECIARGTPILVNRLPSVVEILGEDYPFYFDTLDEAAQKLDDENLIHLTHNYLATFQNRNKVYIQSFIQAFESSSVYKSL